jgi:hypothetical protein
VLIYPKIVYEYGAVGVPPLVTTISPVVAVTGTTRVNVVALTKEVAIDEPPLKVAVAPLVKFKPVMVNVCPIYPDVPLKPPVMVVIAGLADATMPNTK